MPAAPPRAATRAQSPSRSRSARLSGSRFSPGTLVAVGAAVATSFALAACSGSTTPATPSAGSTAGITGETTATISVLASFYPLHYVATQVAGERATVTSLTPPGAEPHDLELSPAQVRTLGDADLVLYLSQFQAAVDEAISVNPPTRVVDARTVVPESEHNDDHDDDHGSDDGHAHDHDHGADPHFWLDPTLLATLAAPVADALAEVDPAHAEEYAARGQQLTATLTTIDEQFTAGLATCERRTILVAHEAYGFLADRYNLEQKGLAGLDPDTEPSVARLRQLREVADSTGATTVFTDSEVRARTVEQLAADLGLTAALLDPVENQADPARDYRQVMTANLDALRLALGCA